MATNNRQLNAKDLALAGIVILSMYALCRMIVRFIVALVQELYLMGKWIYLSTKQCIAAKKAKDQQESFKQPKLEPHDPQP